TSGRPPFWRQLGHSQSEVQRPSYCLMERSHPPASGGALAGADGGSPPAAGRGTGGPTPGWAAPPRSPTTPASPPPPALRCHARPAPRGRRGGAGAFNPTRGGAGGWVFFFFGGGGGGGVGGGGENPPPPPPPKNAVGSRVKQNLAARGGPTRPETNEENMEQQ